MPLIDHLFPRSAFARLAWQLDERVGCFVDLCAEAMNMSRPAASPTLELQYVHSWLRFVIF
jgi:hypothetical protein